MEDFGFSEKLIDWYQKHKRDLPWRHTQDAYQIWLSEVILQQTRVQQGLPYYERLLAAFPTVTDLAQASESEVLRYWQGLGYYSRARNLHAAAKTVAFEMNGEFPTSYNALRKLKGIGPYTAAAIASFASKEKVAVVDGNVYRVLARVFGLKHDIASHSGKKIFEQLADELVHPTRPDLHNQAIMEFGALHCKPANPDCMFCVFATECQARKQGMQNTLPIKTKKPAQKKRYLHYLVLNHEGQLILRQRKNSGIWQGLYDFPLHEDTSLLPPEEVLQAQPLLAGYTKQNGLLIRSYQDKRHLLTHQALNVRFLQLEVKNPEFFAAVAQHWQGECFGPEQIHDVPKPILIHNYLKEYIY